MLIAACGRLDFDPIDASSEPIGHDEDGDGVPDTIDVCPHLAGSQLDSDGDGVGDDCDPSPLFPNQHLLLFATLQPGDQPFPLGPNTTQEMDSLHSNGSTTGDHLTVHTAPYTSIAVAFGADLHAATPTMVQHQYAIEIGSGVPPSDFVELNDIPAPRVRISHFDGSTYTELAGQDLAMGIHPGSVFLQLVFESGTMTVDAAWFPGEHYHFATPSTMTGGDQITLDIRSLDADIRYAWAIAW